MTEIIITIAGIFLIINGSVNLYRMINDSFIKKVKSKDKDEFEDHGNTKINMVVNGKRYTTKIIQEQFKLPKSTIYSMYYSGRLEEYLRNNGKQIIKRGRRNDISSRSITITKNIPDKFLVKYRLKPGDKFETYQKFNEYTKTTKTMIWDWEKRGFIIIK